jgi:hypothetical protein
MYHIILALFLMIPAAICAAPGTSGVFICEKYGDSAP